jgi:hypothetical protein
MDSHLGFRPGTDERLLVRRDRQRQSSSRIKAIEIQLAGYLIGGCLWDGFGRPAMQRWQKFLLLET